MPSSPAAAPARLALFDNARGLLVLLVGAGHALEPLLPDEPLARGLYAGLYLFHIPAFAALSGHLSRAEWSGAAVRSLLRTVGAPLLIFQVLYVAFDVAVLNRPLSIEHLTRPYWLLWFLLSLLCWRLLLPLLVWTRAPLIVSIALALGAGLVPWIGYGFSASRTLVFLPCFVAGHLCRREWLLRCRSPAIRACAWAAFAVLTAWTIGVALGRVDGLDTRWLYGSSSYAAMGVANWSGVLIRAALLAVALALTAAFFALAPSAPIRWLTGFGGTSLAPYLLHGFAVRLLAHLGFFTFFGGGGGVLAAALIGAGVVAILGSRRAVRLSFPLVNPFAARARGRMP